MLEKPDIKDEKIITCLKNEYGLRVDKIGFLPLGAYLNMAMCRAESDDETPYFKEPRGASSRAGAGTTSFPFQGCNRCW
jgi:spectinomycin phosphotransferase